MMFKRIAYETSPSLVTKQKKFWDNYYEMDDMEYVLKLLPVKNVVIEDEFPEPETVPLYQKAMSKGVKFPPILVQRPSRKEKRYRVVDGKHRFTAAQDNKATHIWCLIETEPKVDKSSANKWLHVCKCGHERLDHEGNCTIYPCKCKRFKA